MIFACDPAREAIFLVAVGDRTGHWEGLVSGRDPDWADERFTAHLAALKSEEQI